MLHFQDAFFGRELLDTSKDNSRDIESSESDSAGPSSVWKMSETVVLSQVRIIIFVHNFFLVFVFILYFFFRQNLIV